MRERQIFQTDSRRRWEIFLWSIRGLFILLLTGIATMGMALLTNSNPKLPELQGVTDRFTPLPKPDQPLEFKGKFKKRQHKPLLEKELGDSSHTQIRAGFYVNWDLQSYFSLRNNIGKMNMVLPEWLFVEPNTDTIITQIDPKAYKVMDSSQAKIVPLLSNFFGNRWNHESITRIVESPEKKARFIAQLVSLLEKYKFAGVGVDFEELASLKEDQSLVDFHRDLYDALHAHHLLATQCIPPFSNDYRISELHKFNDYIFVMAYDQYFSTTKQGPVSDVKWVERVLDDFTEKIEPDKFVLCLAAYGYDWPDGGVAESVTYQQALANAHQKDAKIDFDNTSYNLHYNYTDGNQREHHVWFADAATGYNVMRTAAEYGLAGVSVWRLGSEDSRLWNFYDKDLQKDSLALNPPDMEQFTSVKASNDIDYIGEGEVLDVISTPVAGKISVEYNPDEKLISEESYISLPSCYVVKKFGSADPRTIILTFDDGPDPKYTPGILKILKQENVPAAFFMIGENIQNNIPLVKKMFDEGYEIGNHSFSHPNLADVSPLRVKLELNSTRRLIETITNHSTILFRPPYNADIEPTELTEIAPVEAGRKANYLTIGESIDPQDWDARVNADTIYNRVIRQLHLGSVVLLHDAGGNRTATVEALPRLIHYFKENGYHFGTISELVGKSKDDLMPPIVNPKEQMLNNANYVMASSIYWTKNILSGIFFIGIFLYFGRMLVLGLLAFIQNRKSKIQPVNHEKPFVSIIIPAYNENVHAIKTVQNLLKSDYPAFEIIFVNDGSKDDTFEIVSEAFKNSETAKIFNKANGGKASALNFGIKRAKGDFVVCIDADTQLRHDAISRLMESFTDENVGAVAGNVKVGNEVNMLTKWQSIEYTTSQNFDRRAFDLLNCITVIPGAIGAFRKEAIEKAGWYSPDTLAEDCDLTVRLLRNGYTIKNNNQAIAMTESPENLKQFLKQRFRWTFGVMQTFWKHRDALFSKEHKSLGWIALPNILFFQIMFPCFAPLADLVMVFGIFSNNGARIALYYLLFQLVDLAGSAFAFSFERVSLRKLWLVIPQRFTYRWLMYYVFFKALTKAIKGELQHWGVLKRTGNVSVA